MPVAYTGDAYVTALGTLGTPWATAEPWRAGNFTPMPPWKGSGTLESSIPIYRVSYAGSPASVVLDLFDRATNIYIMSTTSDPTDGSFSFSGLNTSRAFDVRARGDGFTPDENDMILANVVPA